MKSSKESREMYLEVMLRLEKPNGVIRSIDIAKELGYSKPSVSRAVRILAEAGYVTHSRYGEVLLTATGREKAEQVYHKHHVLTEFFVQALELDPATAEEDACRMEHVISDKALQAIESFLLKRQDDTTE